LRLAVEPRPAVAPRPGTATASPGVTGFQGAPGAVPLVTVDGITVHAQMGGRVAGLLTAARTAGLEMSGSGYRTAAAQVALRRAHCGVSSYATYTMPASRCSPPTAPPGESLHEWGLAIDFTCGAALVTSGDSCFRWLADHAAEFGLFNFMSEPWHWSVNGQ
jgi:LAS superfamily LD-carboxypeptidase LdcB